MTYPSVRLVSAPDLSADVLFDCNTTTEGATRGIHADDWSIGTPSLEGDVDAIDPVYGSRTLTLTQEVKGTKAQALAAQSQLARLLLRGPQWAYFQLAASTDPVWFRTYRADSGDLSFGRVYNDSATDTWEIPLSLPAEPFAYGERVHLGPFTVNNDPAHATNGCHVVLLPEIIGDAPAPLRLGLDPSDRGSVDGRRWLASVHAGSEAQAPIVWPIGTGDVWTPGIDTGAAVANAAYSGGSYRPVTFATFADMQTRLFGDPPSVPPPGRYKVLLRVARGDTDATFSFRFGQIFGSETVYGQPVVMDRATSAAAGYATYVDLGEFTFPFGLAAPAGVAATTEVGAIALDAAMAVGGSARLDALVLVPVDLPGITWESRSMFAESHVESGWDSVGVDTFDGDYEAYWKISGTNLELAGVPEIVGQFPRVVPGAENVLTLLPQVNARGETGWDGSDSITATTEVDVSYHPRFLWIGDR